MVVPVIAPAQGVVSTAANRNQADVMEAAPASRRTVKYALYSA